ncbi:50S ribosomal protein L24 [Candidatus Nitrosotenuis cloacae]|uniref:Large ribosomal subunit protein uL24 n=1 Tax=Candidatus Nitrosotenuis cloacae TaxID=1603555 RepID=A0A3G1B1B8_9ARCH|nr:50S ribosomal protein L24 [Candidatus Nitrosotenuis cloacae]AJZ75374.1 50S ribosomal protein L24 [Candidatus Nitrosotenuis cloacae]
MKPTTIRNRTIYQAAVTTRSKLMCSHLSKDLQQKYHRRSVRVTEGDTVKVLRGEFKGVSGKITRVSTLRNGIAIEGIKKEKLKGGNLDIFIHTSNVLVTDLNTEDKWRINKVEGKNPKPVKESKPKETPKPAPKKEAKPAEKKETKKETSKETKAAKNPKKETK